MVKQFRDVKIGNFFKWSGNSYVKLNDCSTKNAFCVSPAGNTLASTFGAGSLVTECDVAITEKKLTLADIKIGTKFRLEDNKVVFYVKSDEKHRSKHGMWCVMNVHPDEIYKILPMALDTKVVMV